MTRQLARIAGYAVIGAFMGAIAAAFAFAMHPAMTLELDRDLPEVTTGFYPVERANDEAFAWTSARADVSLPGFDRGAGWSCSVEFRGARPPGLPQPALQVASDGDVVSRGLGTNQYQALRFEVPARSQGGLRLTFVTTPAFVPSSSDRRELGVQVRGLGCVPEARVAAPPAGMLAASAISMAIFAAMLAALATTEITAAVTAVAVATALAFALSTGMAPYSRYVTTVPWVAAWIAVAVVAGSAVAARLRRRPLDTAPRMAIVVSAAFLLVELAGLLHPSKGIADALFHAHRLEWVLGGRFYFTQPMPSGVSFPYAIALYVIAAPWSYVTHDYMALLKVVVLVARALAALMLYPLLARVWNDRVAGILAIFVCHLVPLPFSVLAFANLTYAFGQSATAATLAWIAMYPAGRRSRWWLVALFLLATLACLSHVGLFPLLLAMMCATAVLYRWSGALELRPASYQIVLAAVLAAVVSVALYYGHFPESYRTLQRLRPGANAAIGTATPAVVTPSTGGEAPQRVLPARGPGERLGRTVVIAELSFGWAVLALAILGAVMLWMRRARDPVTLLAAACVVVYAVFVTASALTPIEPRFQRYAEEFISRVNFAVVPIVALLAARGVTWAWSRHVSWRVAVAALVAVALVTGAESWLTWLG
jgi:hypothetical protein